MDSNIVHDQEIQTVCNGLISLFDIEKLIVFGVKRRVANGKITDMDICLVCNCECDKNSILKRAYLEIDTDIPYDLFLYTPSEWDSLTQKSESFASRIARKGHVFYEKQKNV